MAEYKILDRLGDGSCGVVYRALQVELHREVALKMIRSGLWQAGETHERFSREIRACVELAHPNIVKVFDAGVMEGQLFIAMELIQGMTLLDMRCESGPVAIPRAAHLIGQAADALAHVHERGLVHRDVKPANLMADRSGHVTLMDFGLVKMLDATLLTGEGATIGTPRYLAPEGFDSRDVSPAQDVWALALTMHELIIGKPWIEGPVPRLLAAILGKEPITLRTEAPHAPESLLELQARALERDPKRRLTATQYRDGLGEIADRSAPASRCARGGPEPRRGPSPPRRPGPMQPVRAGAEPRTRRSFWPVAASLSLVLFGLALGIRSRVVVPVASPSPATGFEPRLQRPWFPGHRSLATRFAHPPPPGTAVELVAAGRTLARTAPDSDGAVLYDDLEPALAAGLRVVIPGQGSPGGLFPVTTPRIVPVIDLAVWPTDRSVLVDFDLPRGHAFEVKIGGWKDRHGLGRRESAPGDAWFRYEFMGLRPSTDYRLDIIEKGGWASVAKLRFRTPPGTHAQAVAEVIEIFDRRPRNAAAEAEYLTSLPPKGAYFRLFPDTRVAAPFTRYLKTSDPEAIASVSQFCWLAKNLRDREIAGALLPLLEHPSMASHSGAILEALAASRHPKGLSIALSMVDRVSYPEHAAAVGTILQRSGDPRHWSVLASILTRYPSWWHLLKPMVSLDRERTRRLALDWLEVPQGDRVRTEAAIHALTRLADADAARRLTSLFRVPSAGSWRETLLQSFVAQDTDEARAGLERLLLEARADSSGLGCLWAATRLGIGQAVPLAARMARVSGDAAVRRDGIVCLALLEERSEVPLIRRALEDPDPAVSQAAAWALGRLGDSPSVPRLLARALSSADVGGVATWSLGQVGGREEAIALRALFVRLEGSPAASDQTRLGMVAWALGELGDATSAGKIRFVAGEKRFSPFARACAREALLRLAEIRSEPIGSLARTAVPRALVRCVFPFVRYDRTSVRLLPGESVDLSAQGYWGGSDPGGQMVRFDLPLPLPGLLPRPPVLADPPGDIPVGLLHMNLNSLVGGQSKLLTEKPSCLTAEREGNLVLSPLGGPRFVERSLPTVPGLGMAWVRIDR